ncbi:MAG: hypothetical protein ACE5D8_01260 [Fidelibacterota bacterium]
MKNRISLSVILLLFLQPVFGNYAFYNKVRKTCETYRVDIVNSGMELTASNFSLELESKRNDFEMTMLVGFAAAGQALIHQQYLAKMKQRYTPILPQTIQVVVHVPLGRKGTVITARASASNVQRLAEGTLKSSEFIRLIKDSITTL